MALHVSARNGGGISAGCCGSAKRGELGVRHGASDASSSHSSEGREHVSEDISDQGELSDASEKAVLADKSSEHGEPPGEPETTVTAESITERAAKMFVVGASGVVASGLPPLAPEPTKVIVQFAAKHMKDLKKADVDALSESFGNFDRTVGLGWLIGDSCGRPLMERKEAHAAGLKAARAAGSIKTDVRAAKLVVQRAACKLAADDPQREQLAKQAADVEAAILREQVDVALPVATPAPRASASVSRASGSRKRAREAEPSDDDLIAEAEGCLLKAEKEVKRAEARQVKAEAAQEDAWQRFERVSRKYDGREDVPDEQLQRNHVATVDAQFAWMDAVCKMKDAANDVSLAMLEASEAEKEFNQLQWNDCVRALDSVTEKHSKLVDAYAELARTV